MALANTLIDNFDGTLDTTKWSQGGIWGAYTSNGELYVNLGKGGGDGQGYAWTRVGGVTQYYDFTNNSLYFQATWQGDNPSAYFEGTAGSSNSLNIVFTSTGVQVMLIDSGGSTTGSWAGVADKTYYRVRNSGNDWYIDEATNPTGTWTTKFTRTGRSLNKNLYVSFGAFNEYSYDAMKIGSVNTPNWTTYNGNDLNGGIGIGAELDGVSTFNSLPMGAGVGVGAEMAYTKIMNTSLPEKKLYLAKVYDPENNYLGAINDITDDPTWNEEINSTGSTLDLVLARNSDSVIIKYEPLLDSDGNEILDSSGNAIMTSRESRSKIGLGSLIAHGNRVDLWLFYKNAPNGIRKFTGFINEIGTRYGGSESTVVQLMSYGYDLDQYVVETEAGATTYPMLSYEPSNMIREHFDNLPVLSGGETYTTYNEAETTTVLNHVANPSFESDISGWSATNATLSQASVIAHQGTNHLQVASTGTNPTAKYTVTGLTVGQMYTFSAYVFVDGGHDVQATSAQLTGSTLTQTHPISEYYRIVTQGTATSASVTIEFTATTLTSGMNFFVDSVMLVQGDYMDMPYFDGSTADTADNIYAWTGFPHESTSTNGIVTQHSTIDDTGSTVSYTWREQTYKEMLDKVVQLAPHGWYYRIGLGDNLVYFKQKSTTPHHKFRLGKHIEELDMRSYSANAKNDILFAGGGDPALYRRRRITPVAGTRRGLARMSDNRVELTSSADILTQGEIDEKKDIQFRCTVTILASDYDIETIHAGESVGWENFDNYVDDIVLQIVGLDYQADKVTLQLDTLAPSPSKRLEDLRRNLNEQETENVPATPVEV